MLNGLLLLLGDKNKIPGLVYRLLRAVLTDEGVCSQGSARNDWKIVLDAIRNRTGLSVENFQGPEVETTLRMLSFKKQVAVFDIAGGSHSILLTGRSEGWIEAFDPDWDNVKKKREKPNAYVVQPQENKQRRADWVNVILAEDYLLRAGRGRKGEFQMGAMAARTLTVLEKR